MAKDNEQSGGEQPVTPGNKTKVRLGEIVVSRSLCRRQPEELTEDKLAVLMTSLREEGLQVPIMFFVEQGHKIVVDGHRRVQACWHLAMQGVPGFSVGMMLDALELTEEEAFARFGTIKITLDRQKLLHLVKELAKAGVQPERAARALGLSLVKYQCLLAHANDRASDS